jgi:hypothetical protein
MAERVGVDQALRFRRQRAEEERNRPAGACAEVGHYVHRIRVSGAGARVGGCRSRACRTPWRATRAGPRSVGADDEQRFAAEFVSRCVRSPTVARQTPLPRCRAPREASERQHRNLSWSLR